MVCDVVYCCFFSDAAATEIYTYLHTLSLHVARPIYIHERYGNCNSVYVRFRRGAEQGVWDALLQTLVDLGLTDDWQHMIDSTSVRGHVSAAGGKGGLVRTLLVDHAAALRAKSTPAATIKACLSASS